MKGEHRSIFGKTMGLIAAPWIWMFAIGLWAATLFVLSSFSKTLPDGGPEIPHIDKVLHFGYFFGGGYLLATWQLLRYGTRLSFVLRFVVPALIFAIIGALDEYHQTFTPGRSGNDPFDWLADFLGAITGFFLAARFHPLLLKIARTSSAPISEN